MHLSRFLPLLACAGVLRLAAAGPSDSHSFAERTALAYVKANADDAGLADAMKKLGLNAGAKRDEIAALVRSMRAVLAEGVTADSDAFWMLLGEASPAPTPAPASRGAAQDGAPTPPPNEIDQQTQAVRSQLPEYLRNAITVAEKATAPIADYHAFFHTGLRVLAPYHVNGGSAVDNTSTAVGGYLEFVYTDMWTWRPERLAASKNRVQAVKQARLLSNMQAAAKASPPDTPSASPLTLGDLFWVGGLADFHNGWDFQTRIAFNFGGSDAPSANTITGAGDCNTEIAVDKHLFRGWTDTAAYSFSLGGSVGATTDKAALRVHQRYLYGASFSISFDDPLPAENATTRKALFNVRAGEAWVDRVRFLRDPAFPPLTLRTTSPGVPRFSLARGKGIEAELFYPLRQQSFITLGVRAYRVSDDSLSPWSLYLGVTTPLTEVVKSLFPK